MTVRPFLPALGLALSLFSPSYSWAQTQPPVEKREVAFDSTLSERPGRQNLGFSIAAEDAPVCLSGRPQPVALLASLGPGLNAANDGTAIRFALTGSGLKLLTDGAFSSDTFSDEGGRGSPGMHLTLRPGVFAGGRRPLLATTAWRYSFYNPEMNLLAESELKTTAGTPAILYEYVWFNGHPVAQVDTPVASPVTHWTFTDHLGTPLIQTDSLGNTYWQAEYEPFGKVFTLRTQDQHQPLRLPGQEAEKLEPLSPGPNGATERSYNIFRWYRNGWGRYTQPDPIGLNGGMNLFGYALDMPLSGTDPFGLAFSIDRSCDYCDQKAASPGGWNIQERIRSEGDSACSQLWAITDIKLRKCIQKSCDHGKVNCRGDCGPDRGAEAPQPPKWRPFASRTATFCTNTTMYAHPGWFGGTLIHEFAHGCSWGHGEGKGVP